MLFYPNALNLDVPNSLESPYFAPFFSRHGQDKISINDYYGHNKSTFNLLMGIYEEVRDKKQGYQLYLKGYIYQLIASMLRSNILNTVEDTMNDEYEKRIRKVINYISKHYDTDITLKSMADMTNLSYYNFSRLFKRVTGKCFKDYLTGVRISEAEKYLIDNKKSIADISESVGFVNVSSFNRAFKRITGVCPSDIKGRKERARDTNKFPLK